MNLGPPPQQLRCSAGVGIQRQVVEGLEVHLTQLRYPSIQFRMPFVVPLLHEAAGLVRANRRHRIGDAATHDRHEPNQERHQKSGRRTSVLTAERNQAAVVPAADLGKLKGFCQEAKLAEHAPDGFVPRLRPCATERLIGVHGLGA